MRTKPQRLLNITPFPYGNESSAVALETACGVSKACRHENVNQIGEKSAILSMIVFGMDLE
jgi:hypothetical protein